MPEHGDEGGFVERLQGGDEAAFRELFASVDPGLRRLARTFARTDAVAEEIVGETWLAVVKGLDRFEGRSSLKTWISRILVNTAKTRATREARSVPVSSVAGGDGSSVDPDRFFSDGTRLAGHWRLGPSEWGIPDERALAKELREEILAAIEALGDRQREVITLRDIAGWDSGDVRNALGLSEVNQRVLLHRARANVRAAVEEKLGAIQETT